MCLILGSAIFITALADGFSLSSKYPQVSRTLLSILADLKNAVVWMVSTCPLISKSSSSLLPSLWGSFRIHQLQLVSLSPPYSIPFLNSLARSCYLSLFLIITIIISSSCISSRNNEVIEVKLANHCRGRSEGSLFKSNYTEVALLISLDYSTYPWSVTL